MAIWIVRLLSSSEAWSFYHASLGCGTIAPRGQCCRFQVQVETSLFSNRLVLVFGNAGARERDRSGWYPSSRRSLYLLTADRSVYSRDLVRCRRRIVVAPSTCSRKRGNGLINCHFDVARLEANNLLA